MYVQSKRGPWQLGGQTRLTGWAFQSTGWVFAHPVNMLEEALAAGQTEAREQSGGHADRAGTPRTKRWPPDKERWPVQRTER